MAIGEMTEVPEFDPQKWQENLLFEQAQQFIQLSMQWLPDPRPHGKAAGT
jgi:hypothetical protein